MENGIKSKVTTSNKDTEKSAPANWPFPTYKGKKIVVDNSKKSLLAFIKNQPEAIF